MIVIFFALKKYWPSIKKNDRMGPVIFRTAEVVKLVDTLDSGSSPVKGIGVRVPSSAPPFASKASYGWHGHFFTEFSLENCAKGVPRSLGVGGRAPSKFKRTILYLFPGVFNSQWLPNVITMKS